LGKAGGPFAASTNVLSTEGGGNKGEEERQEKAHKKRWETGVGKQLVDNQKNRGLKRGKGEPINGEDRGNGVAAGRGRGEKS